MINDWSKIPIRSRVVVVRTVNFELVGFLAPPFGPAKGGLKNITQAIKHTLKEGSNTFFYGIFKRERIRNKNPLAVLGRYERKEENCT